MERSGKNMSRASAPSTSRRSFIWKMGAGVSAAAAAAVTTAKPVGGNAEDPALRAALLEEEKVLRNLHREFEEAIDQGRHQVVVALFAEDAEVLFNGGVFRHRAGITRLFAEYFPAHRTGARMVVAPGFEASVDDRREHIEVAADRATASARFPYSIQAGEPLETDNSLASMARLQGEGVRTWWEGGQYRVDYRRDGEGRWRIARLEYATRARADYRPGRSLAGPITVARFAKAFPEDRQGPDALA